MFVTLLNPFHMEETANGNIVGVRTCVYSSNGYLVVNVVKGRRKGFVGQENGSFPSPQEMLSKHPQKGVWWHIPSRKHL